MRSKEFELRAELQSHLQKLMGFKQTIIIEQARFNLEGVEASKRKIREKIATNELTGWDDPRTWSLQALKKRGIQPQALKNFCLSQGLSQGETTVPIENLYSENRKIIEKDANRYFFVENPVKIQIKDAPIKKVELDLHPDFPKKGKRKFTTEQNFYLAKKDFDSLKENKIYRLMECLNFKKTKQNFVFVSQDYKDFKDKGEKIMHYLPVNDFLIKVDVVLEDAQVISGLAETGLQNLKIGEIVQFERFGFVKLDRKEKQRLVFYFIHK